MGVRGTSIARLPSDTTRDTVRLLTEAPFAHHEAVLGLGAA